MENVRGEMDEPKTAESNDELALGGGGTEEGEGEDAADELFGDLTRSHARSDGRLEAEDVDAGRRREGVGAGADDAVGEKDSFLSFHVSREYSLTAIFKSFHGN